MVEPKQIYFILICYIDNLIFTAFHNDITHLYPANQVGREQAETFFEKLIGHPQAVCCEYGGSTKQYQNRKVHYFVVWMVSDVLLVKCI